MDAIVWSERGDFNVGQLGSRDAARVNVRRNALTQVKHRFSTLVFMLEISCIRPSHNDTVDKKSGFVYQQTQKSSMVDLSVTQAVLDCEKLTINHHLFSENISGSLI